MDSAITTKGQITIPKAIREHLGLRPGDRVKFFVHDDGSVVLLPKLQVTALRGMIKGRQPPVTIDDMGDAAERLDQRTDGIDPIHWLADGRDSKAVAQDATHFLLHRMPVRRGVFLQPGMQAVVDVANDQGWQGQSPSAGALAC